MTITRESVMLIGAGRLGSALARALHAKGFVIAGIVDRDVSRSRRLVNLFSAAIALDAVASIPQCDIIMIAVPDDEIETVVSSLQQQVQSRNPWRFVFHTSGALTSDILMPLKTWGIAGGSFHPLQTFAGNDDDWKKLSHIYIGIEGDSAAVQKAIEISQALNSKAVLVPREFKMQYHLACTMASNYLIALLVPVVEMFRAMGYAELAALDFLFPLLSTTVANLHKNGLERALTGPLLRGDVGTLTKHLQLLEADFPAYSRLYRQMGEILLGLPSIREKLSEQKYLSIMQLLHDQRT